MLFATLVGALAGIVSDVIGAIFLSAFGYFPGFTLAATLTGAIPLLVLALFKDKDRTYFFAILITDIVTSIFLNTLWLNMMTAKDFLVLLPPRLKARAILLPITASLLYILIKKVRVLKLV